MSFFDSITTFESIADWSAAYSAHANTSIPSVVCVEMAKLMKTYGLTFVELAKLIEDHDGLAGARDALINTKD